jgi:hypothetical protein
MDELQTIPERDFARNFQRVNCSHILNREVLLSVAHLNDDGGFWRFGKGSRIRISMMEIKDCFRSFALRAKAITKIGLINLTSSIIIRRDGLLCMLKINSLIGSSGL